MLRLLSRLVGMALVLPLILSASGRPLPGDDDATRITSPTADTGSVEGIVRYEADPKQPWRYARYYVHDRESGALAEAVVALNRRGADEAGRTPQTFEIDQQNFQFTPETIAIREGDSIRFLNHDEQLHNVQTSQLRTSFNVSIPPDGEHTERFAHAGGIARPNRIGCVFHSAMRAWVFVFDHPSFQVTEQEGTFKLENVPPGQYTIEMVHPAGELRARQTVRVTAGQTARVEFRVSPLDKMGSAR